MVNIQKHWVLYSLDVVVIVVQSLSRVQICNSMDCKMPRLPWPSLSPRVCSSSCPLSQWCHPTVSSFIVASSPLAFSLTSESFPVSQLFASGGLSVGASVSVSAIPMSIQGWFPIGLTDSISLLSNGLSRVFSNNTFWKYQFFSTQPSLSSNSHNSKWLLEKL